MSGFHDFFEKKKTTALSPAHIYKSYFNLLIYFEPEPGAETSFWFQLRLWTKVSAPSGSSSGSATLDRQTKKTTYFECGEVPLDTLVLPLELLHTGQVLPKVVTGEDGVLLRDPGYCLICVPERRGIIINVEEPAGGRAVFGIRTRSNPDLYVGSESRTGYVYDKYE
jgi:hypothetical protein